MFAIMVVTMAVGTAMDMTPTILTPILVLMPLVKAAGIDPVYLDLLFLLVLFPRIVPWPLKLIC